ASDEVDTGPEKEQESAEGEQRRRVTTTGRGEARAAGCRHNEGVARGARLGTREGHRRRAERGVLRHGPAEVNVAVRVSLYRSDVLAADGDDDRLTRQESGSVDALLSATLHLGVLDLGGRRRGGAIDHTERAGD